MYKALNKIAWYIDESYVTHADIKGQSGAVIMTGESVVFSHLMKQN